MKRAVLSKADEKKGNPVKGRPTLPDGDDLRNTGPRRQEQQQRNDPPKQKPDGQYRDPDHQDGQWIEKHGRKPGDPIPPKKVDEKK